MQTQINKIRDILRTAGITDQTSISHCISFIVLRKLTVELCEKLNIPNIYSFQNFCINLDEQEIWNKFYKPTGECFVSYLRKGLGFTSFKFNTSITPKHLYNIFNILKTINIEQLELSRDIVGDIYELHLKTGSKSSRDLGQFFTNRKVIEFMVSLAEPKPNNKIIDPTMGTGGFLTMVLKYMKDNNININPDCIFGYDIDNSVKEYASLNLLLQCGIKFKHLYTQDTLSVDINESNNFDIILANEPMGIKGLQYTNFCSRIKEMKISGTKAEPAFLQLFMNILKDNGKCAVIVPEGVLFNTNNQFVKTREKLITDFYLEKIIRLKDKRFFINTRVHTCILFFHKIKKENYDIIFSEISLDKTGFNIFETEIGKINTENIDKYNYSLGFNILNNNDCQIQSIQSIQTIQTIKEICERKILRHRVLEECLDEGKYPVISSAKESSKFLNEYDCEEKCLIFNKIGKFIIHLKEKFCVTRNTHVLTVKDENIIIDYIYYYLKYAHEKINQYYLGTTKPKLSLEVLYTIQIPVFEKKKQIEIINNIKNIENLEDNIKNTINSFTTIFQIQCDLFLKNCNNEKKLDELCEIVTGRPVKKEEKEEKEEKEKLYPIYGGGITIKEYHSIYNREGEDIVITRVGKLNITYIKSPYYLTNSGCALKPKNIDIKYLYYTLLYIKDKLYSQYHGTIQKSITNERLKNVTIPFLNVEKQKEFNDICNNIFDTIKNLENQLDQNIKLKNDLLKKYFEI